MASLSDTELQRLIQSAKGGSRAALGTLLEAYRQYLALLARLQIDRKLQGRLSVSDVVQDTFLQAHHKFNQFQGTGERELMAWLRRILASQLANAVAHHGAARRNVAMERQLDADLDQSSQLLGRMPGQATISSPSARATRREQAVLLADALGALPAHYREVIVLRHLEGNSFAQIAQRMARTVPSVKNLWTRALTQLRIQVGDG